MLPGWAGSTSGSSEGNIVLSMQRSRLPWRQIILYLKGLILIMALRFGQLNREISTCIEIARKRPSNQLLWKDPQQALFPSIRPDLTIDFTQACHPNMISKVLRRMYPLAGATEHLTSMSLRRGFSHDLAQVPNLSDN